MQLDALASGSSGNAYLLRAGNTALLLEAGLPASKLAKLLSERGVDPRALHGILLTHAHIDHRQGARELSDRYRIPIYATAGTLGHRDLRDAELARPIQPERHFTVDDVEVVSFRVPHDCVEPVGFRLEADGGSVCLTTDLGFVPASVQARLAGADLLVLEANHDEQMLWQGPYPSFLKRRVGGECGHLSNAAAAQCLVDLADRPPSAVWLAHLSLVNNRINTAVADIGRALQLADLGHVTVAAAGRNRPSLTWHAIDSPRQLHLL